MLPLQYRLKCFGLFQTENFPKREDGEREEVTIHNASGQSSSKGLHRYLPRRSTLQSTLHISDCLTIFYIMATITLKDDKITQQEHVSETSQSQNEKTWDQHLHNPTGWWNWRVIMNSKSI